MEPPTGVVTVKPDPDSHMNPVEGEGSTVDQPATTPSGALAGPIAALSIQRVSSTAPTLSALSSGNLEAAIEAENKSRLGRQFPLTLDLSAPGLRFEQTEPDSDTKPPASPVTLAPKTARPAADDLSSAIQLMAGGMFDGGPLPLGSMPHSSFSSDAQQQLAVVTNSLNPMMTSSTLLPSAFPQNSGEQSMIPSGLNQEVIDLTQMTTPSFNQTLDLPMNVHDDSAETIDLTMDSPTIPLSQVIAAKQIESEEPPKADNTNLDAILRTVNPTVPEITEIQQSTENNTGLDGLLAFVGLSQAETESHGEEQGSLGMTSDPTSILASLTGANQTQSSLSQAGLDLSGDPFGESNGLSSLADTTMEPFGMDSLQDMGMLFNSEFMGANSGLGDSVADMFGTSSGDLGELPMLGIGPEEATLDLDSLLSSEPKKIGGNGT